MTADEGTRVATGAATRAAGTVPRTELEALLAAEGLLSSATGCTQGAPLTGPRTRFAGGGASAGVPDAAERSELARTLGAELRAVRAAARMSQWLLAQRSGVATSSVEYLEVGGRRPTPSMLAALALGSQRIVPALSLGPGTGGEGEVFRRLLAAAGASMVADTLGGVRRRVRRSQAAEVAYRRLLYRLDRGRIESQWERQGALRAATRLLARTPVSDLAGLAAAMDALGAVSGRSR